MKVKYPVIIAFTFFMLTLSNAEIRKVPEEYASIQEAIDISLDGDIIHVHPGLYTGEIDFKGKAITVIGIPDSTGAPIIENPGDFAVSFYSGETDGSVLKNFVIRNSFMGVFIAGSSPTLQNLTIVSNKYGVEAYANSEPDIRNCIFWDNANSDTFGCEAQYSWISNPFLNNLDTDALGYWSFDESSDEIAIDIAGGHDGIIHGDAHRVDGIAGKAIQFDGINDYVDCGTLETSEVIGDLGFSFWVKPINYGILACIEGEPFDFGEAYTNVAFYLKATYRSRGDILLYAHEYAQGTNEQYDFSPLSWNQWVHVVVVRDTSEKTVTMYYNGDLLETYHYWHQAENPSAELFMSIGSRSLGIDAFEGIIDEVAIFDRILSNQEIQSLYASGLLGESIGSNTTINPQFVDFENGDYHLKSERGRYWPDIDMWVLDTVTSPCIDGGDPNMDCSNEPNPNGNRINMGVFGGTPYASLSVQN